MAKSFSSSKPIERISTEIKVLFRTPESELYQLVHMHFSFAQQGSTELG